MFEEFKVPQELNIADRIGKFTFPQLGFLAAGLLIVMILLISDIPLWLTFLIGLPVAGICISMAFVKKYGMPLYEYIFIWINYQSLPKYMIYSAVESEDEIEFYDEDYEEIVIE